LYHSRPSAGGKGEGERLAGSHQDQWQKLGLPQAWQEAAKRKSCSQC
jgi:hypothetical protein